MSRKFVCSSCGDPCTLEVGDGAGAPDACPYSDGPGGDHDPDWHEVRKNWIQIFEAPDFCPHPDDCPGGDCCEEGERCAKAADPGDS